MCARVVTMCNKEGVMIEIQIKDVNERASVATALVKNGYRVWYATRKTGKVSVVLLCADRPGKDDAP